MAITAQIPHDLAGRIAALLAELRDLDHDTLHHACAIASDMLADRHDRNALIDESILDGLLWGHHAARYVETGGNAVLRLRLHGGGALTYHLRQPSDADIRRLTAAIDAVLHAPRQPASCCD